MTRVSRPSLLLSALILPALLLTACGVEQSQPAPVVDAENWGHLPPDPERPQQADTSATTAPEAAPRA